MFRTVETFDTEFSADSVEWCPSENHADIFVCGTYQLTLDESKESSKSETKKRVGRIYLFQVVKNESLHLKLLQQLDVAAVLDMKWAHTKSDSGKILLGVVNSEGFLQIYELTHDEGTLVLKFVSEVLTNESSDPTLALSLDWSTVLRVNDELKVSVSDSQGSVSLFKISSSGCEIERIISWNAHNYEAWITAFDYWDTNTVYSGKNKLHQSISVKKLFQVLFFRTGGDDSKFLRYDTRTDCNSPVSTNSSHNAGVTSLHSNWKKEYCLVSGR